MSWLSGVRDQAALERRLQLVWGTLRLHLHKSHASEMPGSPHAMGPGNAICSSLQYPTLPVDTHSKGLPLKHGQMRRGHCGFMRRACHGMADAACTQGWQAWV